MRWGERLEFTAEAGPGDFIYVPPYVPHQEINASRDEPLECVLVRSDNEAVVVNLDIEPVEKPENVALDRPDPQGVKALWNDDSLDLRNAMPRRFAWASLPDERAAAAAPQGSQGHRRGHLARRLPATTSMTSSSSADFGSGRMPGSRTSGSAPTTRPASPFRSIWPIPA